MIYLSIVTTVVLSIMYVSYKVGRAVGEVSSTDERHQLRTANARLVAQVDFLSAEKDIIAGHIAPPRTDPITEWPLSNKWTPIPESMNKEVLYGIGHMALHREAQEKYTAAMRKKLDDLIGK